MAAARIFPIVVGADLVFFGGVVHWARRGRTGTGALRMGLLLAARFGQIQRKIAPVLLSSSSSPVGSEWRIQQGAGRWRGGY